MSTTTHHAECDGFRIAHRCTVKRQNVGRGMFTAECEECGWIGSTFGADAGEDAARVDGAHHGDANGGGWVECDGRCQAWS